VTTSLEEEEEIVPCHPKRRLGWMSRVVVVFLLLLFEEEEETLSLIPAENPLTLDSLMPTLNVQEREGGERGGYRREGGGGGSRVTAPEFDGEGKDTAKGRVEV
jgi:hypothetical protein